MNSRIVITKKRNGRYYVGMSAADYASLKRLIRVPLAETQVDPVRLKLEIAMVLQERQEAL